MIRDRIRQWLGITQVLRNQVTLIDKLADINSNIGKVNRIVSAITPGLGRVIAKLDPMYAKDELDPIRKAESDKLGEEVIQRLKAEDAARRHTTGEYTEGFQQLAEDLKVTK